MVRPTNPAGRIRAGIFDTPNTLPLGYDGSMGKKILEWLGLALFFAVGVSITFAIALPVIDRGGSAVEAIVVAAFFGGFGAWLSFFTVARLLHWLCSGRRVPENEQPKAR